MLCVCVCVCMIPGCTGTETVFTVQLNSPIMHHNSRGQKVELIFASEHHGQLEEAARRVFMVPVCFQSDSTHSSCVRGPLSIFSFSAFAGSKPFLLCSTHKWNSPDIQTKWPILQQEEGPEQESSEEWVFSQPIFPLKQSSCSLSRFISEFWTFCLSVCSFATVIPKQWGRLLRDEGDNTVKRPAM